jgi:hypothetical protein
LEQYGNSPIDYNLAQYAGEQVPMLNQADEDIVNAIFGPSSPYTKNWANN